MRLCFLLLLVSSSADAQKVKQVKQPPFADCVIQPETRCNNQKFQPTKDFERASLENSQFNHTDFIGTSFSDGFDMRGANLSSAQFKESNLSYINWSGATLRRANLTGSSIRELQMAQGEATFATFNESKLSKLNIADSNFNYAKFVKATIQDSSFDHLKLEGANFEGASITHVLFEGSELKRAKFKCATFSKNINFDDAELDEIDLTGADLSNLSNDIKATLKPYFCATAVARDEHGELIYQSTKRPGLDCEIQEGQDMSQICPGRTKGVWAARAVEPVLQERATVDAATIAPVLLGSCKTDPAVCAKHHGAFWDRERECLEPKVNGKELCRYEGGYWKSTCELADPEPCNTINSNAGTKLDHFNECNKHKDYCIWKQ